MCTCFLYCLLYLTRQRKRSLHSAKDKCRKCKKKIYINTCDSVTTKDPPRAKSYCWDTIDPHCTWWLQTTTLQILKLLETIFCLSSLGCKVDYWGPTMVKNVSVVFISNNFKMIWCKPGAFVTHGGLCPQAV